MRTAFFGTPAAAATVLTALAASAHAPAVVVTRPDRPRRRGHRALPAPVKETALELGIPVLQPVAVSAAGFRRDLAAFSPEVLVVVAFGALLGPRLRALAPGGAINLHFSLLPRWRGAAPVARALMAGDLETGVTIMRLVDALDAGPVHLKARLAIDPGETAGELEARLAAAGSPLLLTALDLLAEGRLESTPQDEAAVTWAPPLRKAEGWLDPRAPAAELERRVRGLRPWPGARFQLAGERVLGVVAARSGLKVETGQPGELLPPRGEALPVVAGDGRALLLLRVQPPGRRPMSGAAAVAGRHVAAGEVVLPPPVELEP